MSRRTTPQVNASLIREGRMIFQQLRQVFGESNNRIDNVYAMKAAQAQAEADIAKAKAQASAPALKCAVCLAGDSTTVRDAVTIANGDAVCVTHLVKS
jgi:Tfp pilus assembly protein PilX